MSAALEGALEGVPSIGFSLLDHAHEADFAAAQEVVRKDNPRPFRRNCRGLLFKCQYP